MCLLILKTKFTFQPLFTHQNVYNPCYIFNKRFVTDRKEIQTHETKMFPCVASLFDKGRFVLFFALSFWPSWQACFSARSTNKLYTTVREDRLPENLLLFHKIYKQRSLKTIPTIFISMALISCFFLLISIAIFELKNR